MQPLAEPAKHERDGIGGQNHAHDPLDDARAGDSDEPADGPASSSNP